MFTRRTFLQTTSGALGAMALPTHAAGEGKRPFRLLYSNDLTNTTTCTSPWHPKGAPFRAEMLEASVDEVAGQGVDAHILQPGLAAVPLWPSKVYPLREHYAWIKETYGVEPDGFGRFVLDGGDPVQLFVDRCRLRGQAPIIGFRLNDAHHKEHVDAPRGQGVTSAIGMSVTPFYRDHPEWRIGPKLESPSQHVLDWAQPEVRARALSLLQELCENYDIDGVELDFLRYYSLFRGSTPVAQRRAIIIGFIAEVRALLDRTARRGHRWLGARVPCFTSGFDRLGIELRGMCAAGLEMVNVSPYYFTVQQTDLAAIRQQVPEAAVYLEMCHTTWNGVRVAAGNDGVTFRRTTPEQYQTAAHLAYTQGADGVSLFNFAYFREHGSAQRGPFGEPPFQVLPRLRDRAWLAAQPQHYILAPGWHDVNICRPILPATLQPDVSLFLGLQLAPPTGGWKSGGRLRLQTSAAWGESRVAIRWDKTWLEPCDEVSEPYPAAYPVLLGTPETLRAWAVPKECLWDGCNQLEVVVTSGPAVELVVVDLAAS